jgi:hypothetical protein
VFEIVETDVGGRPMRVFRDTAPSLRTIWDLSAAHGDADHLVGLGIERLEPHLAGTAVEHVLSDAR